MEMEGAGAALTKQPMLLGGGAVVVVVVVPSKPVVAGAGFWFDGTVG
jgi:hypothetical protein